MRRVLEAFLLCHWSSNYFCICYSLLEDKSFKMVNTVSIIRFMVIVSVQFWTVISSFCIMYSTLDADMTGSFVSVGLCVIWAYVLVLNGFCRWSWQVCNYCRWLLFSSSWVSSIYFLLLDKINVEGTASIIRRMAFTSFCFVHSLAFFMLFITFDASWRGPHWREECPKFWQAKHCAGPDDL